MSMHFREHGDIYRPDFGPGRTKQSFKDSADINLILARAAKTGTISHMAKHQAEYGNFAEFDFLGAQVALARGREIFDALPGELRREFGQSPAAFFEFVNDPENRDRLPDILPGLAAPGSQLPDVTGKLDPDPGPVEVVSPEPPGEDTPDP